MKKTILAAVAVSLSFCLVQAGGPPPRMPAPAPMPGQAVFDKFSKPFPGHPQSRLIKMVAELPEFQSAAAQDKQQWDNLAQQINDMATKEIEIDKKMRAQYPVIQQFEDRQKVIATKSAQLKLAVDGILQNDRQIKNIEAEMETLEKALEPLQKQIEELQKKMRLMVEGRWRLLEAKIEKIKEFKASAGFPPNLRALDAEIAELQKQQQAISNEYFRIQREKMKEFDLGKLVGLSMQLAQLYRKMTQK